MRFASYAQNGRQGLATLVGTSWHGLTDADAAFPGTLQSLIEAGDGSPGEEGADEGDTGDGEDGPARRSCILTEGVELGHHVPTCRTLLPIRRGRTCSVRPASAMAP